MIVEVLAQIINLRNQAGSEMDCNRWQLVAGVLARSIVLFVLGGKEVAVFPNHIHKLVHANLIVRHYVQEGMGTFTVLKRFGLLVH